MPAQALTRRANLMRSYDLRGRRLRRGGALGEEKPGVASAVAHDARYKAQVQVALTEHPCVKHCPEQSHSQPM